MSKKNPLSVGFKEFEISARFAGAKAARWDAHSHNRHYVVTVRGVNNRSYRARFDFWTPEEFPEMKAPSDVMDAFRDFLTNAMAGRDAVSGRDWPYMEFCREFGYDPFDDAPKEERAEAWRAFNACKRAFLKWQKLTGLDVGEVYEELSAA